jgi:hypothetical protein
MGFFKTAPEEHGFQAPSFSSAYAQRNGGISLRRPGTLNFSRYPDAIRLVGAWAGRARG